MPSRFFCPNCFAEIGERADICPSCRYAVAGYDFIPRKVKLMIVALRHPIRENRMMAIQLLGDLQCRSSVPVLRAIIDTERDYYIIREAIKSLKRMEDEESLIVLRSLRNHHAKLVRDLVA